LLILAETGESPEGGCEAPDQNKMPRRGSKTNLLPQAKGVKPFRMNGDGMADAAYQAKYLGIARMLWNASEGDPANIPQYYANHLSYTWSDGDISLASLLPKFECYSELEDYEIEESIELLGKVKPGDWPDVEDIEGIDLEELLHVYDEVEEDSFDYVEDNLGLSEQVMKALKHTIESVFGDVVHNIRSKSGAFPSPDNHFLQDSDGTFAGSFTFHGNTFEFEIFPTESGWVCTYRMSAESLKNLPPLPQEEDKSQRDYRPMRSRGW